MFAGGLFAPSDLRKFVDYANVLILFRAYYW